jgi:hypothetical protein
MSGRVAGSKLNCDIVKCAEAIFETANVPITEQGSKDQNSWPLHCSRAPCRT